MGMRKANPTEYGGIRFRSKSEAMFAYIIDNFWGPSWAYEPYEIDDYLVDFSQVVPLQDKSGYCEYLIEYKPAQPTETYLSVLGPKIAGLLQSDMLFGRKSAFAVFCINMFDELKPMIRYEYREYSTDAGIIGGFDKVEFSIDQRANWVEYIRAAKDHRFDLK